MQVTHLSAQRGALVFPVTLAEFIPHRHLNVQHSSAFMERNSLNIVNPFFFFNGLWLNHPSLTFKQEAGASQPFNPAKSICESVSQVRLYRPVSSLYCDCDHVFACTLQKKYTIDIKLQIFIIIIIKIILRQNNKQQWSI